MPVQAKLLLEIAVHLYVGKLLQRGPHHAAAFRCMGCSNAGALGGWGGGQAHAKAPQPHKLPCQVEPGMRLRFIWLGGKGDWKYLRSEPWTNHARHH